MNAGDQQWINELLENCGHLIRTEVRKHMQQPGHEKFPVCSVDPPAGQALAPSEALVDNESVIIALVRAFIECFDAFGGNSDEADPVVGALRRAALPENRERVQLEVYRELRRQARQNGIRRRRDRRAWAQQKLPGAMDHAFGTLQSTMGISQEAA